MEDEVSIIARLEEVLSNVRKAILVVLYWGAVAVMAYLNLTVNLPKVLDALVVF